MGLVTCICDLTYMYGRQDVGRFAYKAFCPQVDSPTSRSFRLHDQVVSPAQFESIRLHKSRFAYTYKSIHFLKIDENLCLYLTKDSYLTVFPVKFRDIKRVLTCHSDMHIAEGVIQQCFSHWKNHSDDQTF